MRAITETVVTPNTIEEIMHEMEWTTIFYFHPGMPYFDWPDNWAAGVWTGPQDDLLCVKPCETNEEAERWLSPCANSALDAVLLAQDKYRQLSAGGPSGGAG